MRDARRALVDRQLRMQLRIFLVIYLIMTALVVEQLITKEVNLLWAPAGFIAGVAIGLLLVRTKLLGWDESEGAVVGRFDALVIAILAAYLVFIIFRSRIISEGVHDADAVGVIGLSLTAGAMLGRVYFTMRGIRRILAAAGMPIPAG